MFDRLKRALRIPVKLGLLIILLLIPLGLLLYQFTATSNDAIGIARYEILGVDFLGPAGKLYEHLAQHRDLSTLVLSGDATQDAARRAKAAEIDADLASLTGVDRRQGSVLKAGTELTALVQAWPGVRDHVAFKGLDAPGSFAEHTEMLAQVDALIRKVGDTSSLILDPDLDSYYLMEAVVVRLPEAAEALGQLRGQGAGVARRAVITVNERAQLGQLADGARRQMQGMQHGFGVAMTANPALTGVVGPEVKETFSGVDAFLNLADRQLVSAETVRISATNVLAAGTLAVGRVFALFDHTRASLRGLLDGRIGRLTRQRDGRLLLSGLLALLALAAALLIARGVNRQVRAIGNTLGEVGIGNLGARAAVLSGDELGVTAQYLNSMLDSLGGLLQSQEERDRIQGSIMKLLEEVSAVAEGDLRASAEVGPDITGAIADSFNYMIGELRQIIDQVQSTSLAVSSAAGGLQTTTENLAQGSSGQAVQMTQASTFVDQMANAIQQVSDNAQSAAQVAAQAQGKARQGSESVARTLEGMTAIRGQVQETSKRIKRLGESSQEIGEIVQVIADIADRTSILALNATIQAAAAGDSGRGFMVIAEEVERLAQRAATASKTIGGLVKTIQSETHEAVSAMEGTTREVVGGSSLALTSARSLQEIEEVSNRLAELTQTISKVTSQHARGSHEVARNMERISDLTNRTAGSTRDVAVSIRDLASLADVLRESMNRFKLPLKAA